MYDGTEAAVGARMVGVAMDNQKLQHSPFSHASAGHRRPAAALQSGGAVQSGRAAVSAGGAGLARAWPPCRHSRIDKYVQRRADLASGCVLSGYVCQSIWLSLFGTHCTGGAGSKTSMVRGFDLFARHSYAGNRGHAFRKCVG